MPGSGWTLLGESRQAIPVGSQDPIQVKRVTIQKGLDRQLVLYWYQSHGRVIPSEYTGKIYMVVDAISMHRTDAALVRVITPLGESSENAAERRAVSFVQQLFPLLSAYIPR
jgi:EpsI family protein